MTKSTGRSKASTGRMNTRTTNSGRPFVRLVAGALALAWPLVAGAATSAGAGKNRKGDKGDDKSASEPEKTLPPILQKALEEKEVQVTEARREAIQLIEDYLRENPKGSAGYRAKEQAEALYKLAELY